MFHILIIRLHSYINLNNSSFPNRPSLNKWSYNILQSGFPNNNTHYLVNPLISLDKVINVKAALKVVVLSFLLHDLLMDLLAIPFIYLYYCKFMIAFGKTLLKQSRITN